MHTLRAPTLQGLILSCRNFTRWFCQIIVSKKMCGIFLIFCRSSFIINFIVRNSFSEPKNQRKWNIPRPIYFKKISAHRFVGLICTNKLKEFFFRNFFQGLGAFFTTATRLIWASFFPQKNNFILFFKGDQLILI